MSLVERLCRDVYFPMGQITVGQVTSMHGILFYLMKEHIVSGIRLAKLFISM